MEIDLGDQSLAKIIIGTNIGNHRADQIVDISARSVEIRDLRKTDRNLPEPLNPFGIVVDLDRNENADAKVELSASRLLTAIFLRLFLISRCAHRAHATLLTGSRPESTLRARVGRCSACNATAEQPIFH
jgi:hypothetical protein